jgi:hypothetical protein
VLVQVLAQVLVLVLVQVQVLLEVSSRECVRDPFLFVQHCQESSASAHSIHCSFPPIHRRTLSLRQTASMP